MSEETRRKAIDASGFISPETAARSIDALTAHVLDEAMARVPNEYRLHLRTKPITKEDDRCETCGTHIRPGVHSFSGVPENHAKFEGRCVKPACKTCGGRGIIPGDCGDSPNEWRDPCPDCAKPAQTDEPYRSARLDRREAEIRAARTEAQPDEAKGAPEHTTLVPVPPRYQDEEDASGWMVETGAPRSVGEANREPKRVGYTRDDVVERRVAEADRLGLTKLPGLLAIVGAQPGEPAVAAIRRVVAERDAARQLHESVLASFESKERELADTKAKLARVLDSFMGVEIAVAEARGRRS